MPIRQIDYWNRLHSMYSYRLISITNMTSTDLLFIACCCGEFCEFPNLSAHLSMHKCRVCKLHVHAMCGFHDDSADAHLAHLCSLCQKTDPTVAYLTATSPQWTTGLYSPSHQLEQTTELILNKVVTNRTWRLTTSRLEWWFCRTFHYNCRWIWTCYCTSHNWWRKNNSYLYCSQGIQ